ncbi:hypothetical protein B0T13DRAFT_472992 [Neurospora crassa]|nr:hypothetical protein B0T13DRAFT_472992 [Neurospora crassa]
MQPPERNQAFSVTQRSLGFTIDNRLSSRQGHHQHHGQFHSDESESDCPILKVAVVCGCAPLRVWTVKV